MTKKNEQDEVLELNDIIEAHESGEIDDDEFDGLIETIGLDELGKKTLGRYIEKAHRDDYDPKNKRKVKNRSTGITRAVDRRLGVNKEETENLDELGKKTLGRYIEKAHRDDYDPKNKRKVKNRSTGITRAVDRRLGVNKEETENLDEFQASLGDPSYVPDPDGVKQTTEKKKDKGDAPLTMKVPASRAGMIDDMVKKMQGMSKENLTAKYTNVIKALTKEDTDYEDDDEYTVASKELLKISAEDVDAGEDIQALFGKDELTEEFKDRAETVFKAAVVKHVNEAIEALAVDADSDVEVATQEIMEGVTEKVDAYLDYVVEEWMEKNELSVNQGIHAEMCENMLAGLKDLFVEHYVDVPESKVDVVEELMTQVKDLEDRVNDQNDNIVEARQTIKEYEQEAIFFECVEDLTMTQAEKLRSLAEGVDYIDAGSYKHKLETLKKQYFDKGVNENTGVVLDDEMEPLTEEDEKKPLSGPMAVYAQHLSQTAK